MIILRVFFKPNDGAQAFLTEIGTTVNATLVTHNTTDVVVAAVRKTQSTDSNAEVSVLYFSFFFFELCFICLK